MWAHSNIHTGKVNHSVGAYLISEGVSRNYKEFLCKSHLNHYHADNVLIRYDKKTLY